MDPTSGAVWAALGAIVLANLLLSGDNAVVIAMAARSLPRDEQKKAIFWGSVAAIALRIVLTMAAVELLQLPYLKVAGALALVWIGVRLLANSQDESEVAAVPSLSAAIRTILFADLVMSIDNVVAVVGAADAAPESYRVPLLVVGLAMSIPLVIAGSTLLARVMERYPIIVGLGAVLLGYLAGQMLVTDVATRAWFAAHVPHAALIVGAGAAALVVAVGQGLRRRGRLRKAA
jgi:YjbE family integral membrane protein